MEQRRLGTAGSCRSLSLVGAFMKLNPQPWTLNWTLGVEPTDHRVSLRISCGSSLRRESAVCPRIPYESQDPP